MFRNPFDVFFCKEWPCGFTAVGTAEGHLIGLAFDGNSEALSGDIVFEPALQRTINVDARFVLWVIDKYAGAKHLIDEMTIVK